MIEVEIPLSRAQRQFADDPHPLKILVAGRRWGKSLLMKAMLTQAGLAAPGRSLLIMPIQSQCNDWFTELYTDSKVESFDNLSQANEDDEDSPMYSYQNLLAKKPKMWPYPLMTFTGTNHRLGFRSFENPTRIRSGNCTGLIVGDEANDLDGKEVNRVLISKILDTRAQIILTSTITHHNYLWDLYLRGQTNDPVVKSWLFTTPSGPAFQGEEGKQRLKDFRSLYTELEWNSEMLCIPSQDGTSLFPYLDQCLNDFPVPTKPEDGRRYIGGLDLGRVHDPEELIITDDLGQVVCHDSFELGLTHEVMAQRVAARCRFWNAMIVADATGAGGSGGSRSSEDSHILTYRAALPDGKLIPLIWSANADSKSKRDIISHLSLMTEQAKVSINKDKFPKLIAQMRRYKLIIKHGKLQGFGCVDGHDDCVAALAQAFWGLKQNWLSDPNGLPLSMGV